MITISLCMIVKNEEAVLARGLDSIKKAVDEIVIVDTGSTDSTKKIAKKYTEHIYDFKWIDDFSAARNYAFSKASMDYQMWFDADDVFPPESLKKLIKLKKTLNKEIIDMVTMDYVTHFSPDGQPILSSTRERLLKREKNYKWEDPVHECIPLSGNVLRTDIAVFHKKIYTEKDIGNKDAASRNLRIYETLEAGDKALTPRQQYYFARELKDHRQWAKSAYYFEKFLYSKCGWNEDNIASCFNLSVCYKFLHQENKILPILFKSFEYDSPRAEIISEIGYYFKSIRNYQKALEWFLIAAHLDKTKSLGFVLIDYWGYIPNIECCFCYNELGNFEKANEYNERAAECYPDRPAVLINRNVLAAKLKSAKKID